MTGKELKKYIEVVLAIKKAAIEHKEYFESILKEISYYCLLVEIKDDEALKILGKLFTDY